MSSELSAPLIAVLKLDVGQEAVWLRAFNNACGDCIETIDNMRQTLDLVDRDVKVCLDAIRNSLDWAAQESCSIAQAHATLNRVLEIIDSITEMV